MKSNSIFWLVISTYLVQCRYGHTFPLGESDELSEDEALAFLDLYNQEYSLLLNQYSKADWEYNTNLTDENAAVVTEWSSKVTEYSAGARVNASRFNATSFSENTKRLLKRVGSRTLDSAEMSKLADILNRMGKIYGTHKVCRDENGTKCLSLDPELNEIMAKSQDADERLWAWRSWHTEVGRLMRPLYVDYVDLKNKLARLNDYDDYGDQWRQKYETKELESLSRRLYSEVEPLYKQLHAYVRRKLYEAYGPKNVNLRGPLPAHLLGDMWGRFWSKLNSLAQPYKEKISVDPTEAMISQNYTVRKMFELGDDFFRSMGLQGLPDSFYRLSMMEKPNDRQVACHATAWDFSDAKDFRIKMCAQVNFDDFLTVHHELGHVQYFQQYAHQPVSYRDGANDGFHEAIGELMSMSVATTRHLRTLGLLDHFEDDPEVDINFLLAQSLSSVSTLPFHLVQDSWRWKVFAGQIPKEQWNDAYWKEKVEVVGVSAPVARDSGQDLDITALFHVCNDYDMIRYFMRTLMQYQFAETLCNVSNHRGPLYKCDFYNSTAAGTALARMLKMGSSRPWPEAMEALTGQPEVSARPLLNYFQPLRTWLEKENAKNDEFIGWEIPGAN